MSLRRRTFLLTAAAAAVAPAAVRAAVTDQVLKIAMPNGAVLDVWVIYPDGYDPTKPIPAVLALPPGTQDLSMVDANFSWWAPEALRRGWLTIGPAAPEGQSFALTSRPLLGPLLDALLKRFNVAGGKFHVAGQSNGGNSGFALALDHPDKVRSLTVLAGYPPEGAAHADLGKLTHLPINMFVGEFDTQYMAPMTATRDALRAAGARPRFWVVPQTGHVLNQFKREGAYPLFALME